MRSQKVVRGAVVVLFLVLSAAVFAGPREVRESRERPVAKAVKRIVRALGDLLTVPVGAPAPAPKP